MAVLVINTGSSSLKYQLLNLKTKEIYAKGICERVGEETSFHKYGLGDTEYVDTAPMKNHDDAFALVVEALLEGPAKALNSLAEIEAVGHRVVQGGKYFEKSVLITEDVMKKIEELAVLSPLHNHAALIGMKACRHHMPQVPMVAVFDTSFFQSLEPKAFMYPLPYKVYEDHAIRKYGAHGTSHRYLAERAASMLGKELSEPKIITLHLGNGCSASAIKDGCAIDTSMGLTPLDGLMMGTRCGAIDSAIVPYLMSLEALDAEEINDLLNKQSGILGISGVSNDLRLVEEAAEAGNDRACLAIDMYSYSIKRYIGMYWAALGGLDGIVLSAGVGENSQLIREKIFEGLEGMGLILDKKKNASGKGERFISPDEALIKIMVIPTDEEYVIARDTHEIVELAALKN